MWPRHGLSAGSRWKSDRAVTVGAQRERHANPRAAGIQVSPLGGAPHHAEEAWMDLIETLAAIAEIRDLKARYFRGVDEKDEALLRDVFADDIEIDYRGSTTDPVTGTGIAPEATDDILRGGEASARLVASALQGVVSVHHTSEPEIEIIDAENARGIWPMVDRLKFSGDGPYAELIGYGHYHETYVLERVRWRIRTLLLTRSRLDFIPRA